MATIDHATLERLEETLREYVDYHLDTLKANVEALERRLTQEVFDLKYLIDQP